MHCRLLNTRYLCPAVCARLVLTRAPLGWPAERAALGEGGYYPLVISGTKCRRETGQAAIESFQYDLSNACLFFSLIGHRSCQGQVKCQNYAFHFRFLRAEFSYKLCTNRSERFYIMFVHNGAGELAYECQCRGQIMSTMVIIQYMWKRKRVTHLVSTIFD